MWIFKTRGAVRYQYLYSTHPSWYIYPVDPIQSHPLFMCIYIYIYVYTHIRSLSCSFRSYPVLSYSILSYPTPSSIWHVQALNRFTFPKRWNQEFKDSVFDALNLALHRDFHSAVVLIFCSHLLHSYVSILTKPSFFQNELLNHHGFVSIKVGDFVDGFTMAGVGEHQGCWILFESRRDAVGHPAKLFGNAWWRMKQDKVKRAEDYDYRDWWEIDVTCPILQYFLLWSTCIWAVLNRTVCVKKPSRSTVFTKKRMLCCLRRLWQSIQPV